ncbi:MAG: InlB B-repeat-containing protein [Candidatus Methanomethylophilus sp.]|jgi:uncharacterized repeat protein (TIGR02543 family)|nr:InlB B-repeat-containing protein [Methanomethylophilus sp.]MCI2092545.1 InlB B-repeat-containing protein [Methanomethylophilus sp.]
MNELKLRSGYIAAAAAIMLIATAAACCLAMAASDSDADAEPEDYGSFWSYAITVQYNPPEGSAAADTVTYDFGDGTEAVTGNYDVVKHVYAAKGDYTITQTATNSVGSVTAQWIVHILGNPTVTYVYGHDLEDKVVTQSNYALAPEGVEAPEIDGFTFMGWYADAGLTKSADMSAPVTEPITLYAKWSADAHPETVTVTIASPDGTALKSYSLPVGGTLSQTDVAKDLAEDGKIFAGLYTDAELGDKFDFGTKISADTTLYAKYTDLKDPDEHGWASIGLAVAGIIALISVAAIRRPAPAIIGLALIALAALVHFGIITW